MTKVTKASCALKAIVKPEHRVTQKKLADDLGCTQQAVSAWLKGLSQPDEGRRQKLESMFQIPVSDWAEVVVPTAPSSDTDVDAGGSGERETQPDESAANDASKSNGTEG